MQIKRKVAMAPLLLTLAIALIGGTVGQEIHVGDCPKIPTVENFNISRYAGVWYEITKIFFVPLVGETCIQANYSVKSDGHIKVVNTGIKSDGSIDSTTGDAYPADPKVLSKLAVQFEPGTKPANYWIVDTDYENYSLVWSCEDVEGLISLELAWVLSRKRTLDANTVSKLKKELEQFGVKINRFVDTDQSNCPK